MQFWIVTSNRREQIPWYRVATWFIVGVIALGAGIALGVLYMLPVYVNRAWAETHAAKIEVDRCRFETGQQQKLAQEMARAALAQTETCGQKARGIGGN